MDHRVADTHLDPAGPYLNIYPRILIVLEAEDITPLIFQGYTDEDILHDLENYYRFAEENPHTTLLSDFPKAAALEFIQQVRRDL